MGPKRQPRALPKERDEAAAAPAPSLAGTGAAAGEAAANLETAAALHAMARTLYYPPNRERAEGERRILSREDGWHDHEEHEPAVMLLLVVWRGGWRARRICSLACGCGWRAIPLSNDAYGMSSPRWAGRR
jgi:hypothetical protein